MAKEYQFYFIVLNFAEIPFYECLYEHLEQFNVEIKMFSINRVKIVEIIPEVLFCPTNFDPKH